MLAVLIVLYAMGVVASGTAEITVGFFGFMGVFTSALLGFFGSRTRKVQSKDDEDAAATVERLQQRIEDLIRENAELRNERDSSVEQRDEARRQLDRVYTDLIESRRSPTRRKAKGESS